MAEVLVDILLTFNTVVLVAMLHLTSITNVLLSLGKSKSDHQALNNTRLPLAHSPRLSYLRTPVQSHLSYESTQLRT